MRNLVTFCLALGATWAAVANAYEFDDPAYNQFLAEDLDDIYTSPLTRNRREADDEKCRPPHPHRGFRLRMCCAEDVLDKMRMEDKELKRACFKEITGRDKFDHKPPKKHFDFDPFDCETAKRHRDEIICVFQCVGQKKELVNENGELNEDAVAKYLKEILSQASYFDSVQDTIIKNCIEDAKNVTAITTSDTKKSCNPAEARLQHCLFKETQLNCPADQIKDQKACTFLREKLTKGEDMMPPGPPGHGPPGPPPEDMSEPPSEES